jgi:flagellar hook-associated protein 2
MSDVYMPGVKSRFNTEKIIEDLMKLERVPLDRTERNIENLQTQKGYWQEVGRRISALRESARNLYSFQNPFNERTAFSSDDRVITAIANRESSEQSYNFTVKQTAAADRFLSPPLDEKMRIESGTYVFTVGKEEISINYRGGTLKDFVETINRRGNDKIGASLLSVQSGTKSLLLESKVTGAVNRLGFSGDAEQMVISLGMMEKSNDIQKNINIDENTVNKTSPGNVSINDGILKVGARSSASLPIGIDLTANSTLILKLETSTRVESSPLVEIPQPPPGPVIPAGSISYKDITIENEPSTAPFPEFKAPAIPERVDNLAVLSLVFADGTSAKLPPVSDSSAAVQRLYPLSDYAKGKTITSLNIENTNTHREISIAKIEVFDPNAAAGGLRPLNPVSVSRDAVITMEGIEMSRPSNTITDIVPGLTLNVKSSSDRPVELNVSANIEAIKDSIISFVGNYNRLMAEVNILIRNDEKLIDELTYLNTDERAAYKKKLGSFSGDSTLNSFKNSLQRTVTAPYPTSMERQLTLLAQIGIGTNVINTGGGYDQSRLRGYLEINEKVLDNALEGNIRAIKELFANDTTGDMLADTGVAFNVDALVKPFVEIGGIIALKTNTIDSRIKQDEQRAGTMERQLAAKERELTMQYARMESAYARMEQMSNSLDSFSQQNRSNR